MSAEQVADLVAALAEQHDMLRARFSVDDAGVIVSQRYLSAADGGPSWGYYDLALCRQSRAELLRQWQSGLDPTTGPICRFVYIFDSRAPGYALMFCAFHHLIVDVVSGASSSAICSGCIRGNRCRQKAPATANGENG